MLAILPAMRRPSARTGVLGFLVFVAALRATDGRTFTLFVLLATIAALGLSAVLDHRKQSKPTGSAH
jgi:hypothetical protein